MIVKTLRLGDLSVNNYVIIDEATNQAVVIDADGDTEAILNAAREHNASVTHVLNTHGHFDHIGGDYKLQKQGAKIFIHKDDEFLVESLKNQLMMFGMPMNEKPQIDGFVEDGQEIEIGSLKFKVFHTPGHSPGGVCYLIDDKLFSGDTLFRESVGRTDLPKGSYEKIGESIVNKLYTLDDNVEVYPGHGPSTTIGHEKENNPFFKANSLK